MSVTTLLAISLGAILTNNFIFSQFLGICPFLGVSKKIDTAVGMGAAVTFVMGLASAVCFGVNKILIAFDLGFMQTVAYILVIAALVQFVEMVIRKTSPPLYRAMGIYLPLITTNCAVLAAATESVKPGFFTKLNIAYNYGFLESVVYTLGVAVGFSLVLVIFAAMRERLDMAPVPKFFRGVPVAFLAAALFSLAFMGFTGMFGL